MAAAKKAPKGAGEALLGATIDSLYAARASRIELARKVDTLKQNEEALRIRIIDMLKKQGLEKGSGKSATASIKKTIVPVVEDWKKTYAYIHKNKAFELLHRRLASTAWSEVIEAGGKVPGVAALEVEDLSLTKS